jgi:hypothetical protein
MSSVVIHGASDDLIEVLGDTLEEFPCDGRGELVVIGPGGEVVEVTVELDESWSASAKIIRASRSLRVETIPRPGTGDGESLSHLEGDMAVRIEFADAYRGPLVYQASR